MYIQKTIELEREHKIQIQENKNECNRKEMQLEDVFHKHQILSEKLTYLILTSNLNNSMNLNRERKSMIIEDYNSKSIEINQICNKISNEVYLKRIFI